MDANEVSFSEGLAEQAAYLDAHPEVGVLSGWMEMIDENGRPLKQLHRTYLSTRSLNHAETTEVAHDAGMRLLTLAASTGRIGVVKRFRILAQALRLSPRLFWSKQVIRKA